MKQLFGLTALILSAALVRAQPTSRTLQPRPVTLTAFSESISLPDLKGIVTTPNRGVRLGTEYYYRSRRRSQLYQTANLGYYRHASLHDGIYLSTELGYRKFIGPVFLDGTLGGGYLHLISRLPVYRPAGNGEFVKASPHRSKFMPTLGLGAGLRVNRRASVLVRYEVFGEMPIVNEIPLLPHRAVHLGVRIELN